MVGESPALCVQARQAPCARKGQHGTKHKFGAITYYTAPYRYMALSWLQPVWQEAKAGSSPSYLKLHGCKSWVSWLGYQLNSAKASGRGSAENRSLPRPPSSCMVVWLCVCVCVCVGVSPCVRLWVCLFVCLFVFVTSAVNSRRD